MKLSVLGRGGRCRCIPSRGRHRAAHTEAARLGNFGRQPIANKADDGRRRSESSNKREVRRPNTGRSAKACSSFPHSPTGRCHHRRCILTSKFSQAEQASEFGGRRHRRWPRSNRVGVHHDQESGTRPLRIHAMWQLRMARIPIPMRCGRASGVRFRGRTDSPRR